MKNLSKQRTMTDLTTQVQTRRGGVVMRRLFLACCLVTLLAGCGDKAKDLYETAQLEEKQFNKPHATELYRQIVEQYPNSPYASQKRPIGSGLSYDLFVN